MDGSAAPEQCLAVLCGDAERCIWPIGARHWWPPPRLADRGGASTRWSRTVGGHCRRHRVTLVASRDLPGGAEITVEEGVTLGGPGHEYAIEATF